MLRVCLLGGLRVEKDGVVLTGAVARRRPSAVLALIAAAASTGTSRDRIVALLWPESDSDRARNNLKQALFAIRRDIGDVIVGTAQLRLDPDVVTCDLWDFRSAIERKDFDRAIAVCDGEFLDGFHIGVLEFDHWLDSTRARVAADLFDALKHAACAAKSAGDHSREAALLERRAALRPLDPNTARELVAAKAQAGDVIGAIRYAQQFEAHVVAELGTVPDRSVSALAERLAAEAHSAEPSVVDIPAIAAGPTTAAQRDDGVASDPGRRPVAQRRFGYRGVAATLVATALLSVLGLRHAVNQRASDDQDPSGSSTRVMVAPFRVNAATKQLGFLREGLIDLLATRLATAHSVQPVDARRIVAELPPSSAEATEEQLLRAARKVGAQFIVTGAVVGDANEVQIDAVLRDVAGRDISPVTVTSNIDSLPGAIDRMASQLFATIVREPPRTRSLLANHPMPAVRAFVEGQAAYRQGRWSDAIASYRDALQRDSTFALAALGAASAAAWTGDRDTRVLAEGRAWSLREQLSPADRAYLDALVGPKHPDSATTEHRLAAWELASHLAGDRPEVWFALGDEYFHNGAVLSRDRPFERAATAFERALALMPDYSSPLTHLIQIRALQHDTSALRSLRPRLMGARGEDAFFARWRIAVALGDSAEVRQLRARFHGASDESLRAIAFTAMEEGTGIGDANRALQTILARSVTTGDRRDTFLGMYALALIQGDHRAATDALDDISALGDRGTDAQRFSIIEALYAGGSPSRADSAAAVLANGLEVGGTPTPEHDRCTLAQWQAKRGDLTNARRAIARLESSNTPDEEVRLEARICAQLLRAIVTEPATAKKRELASLEAALRTGPAVRYLPGYSGIALADLFAQVGDTASALRASRRRGHYGRWPFYMRTNVELEACFAEAAGDSVSTKSARARLAQFAKPVQASHAASHGID